MNILHYPKFPLHLYRSGTECTKMYIFYEKLKTCPILTELLENSGKKELILVCYITTVNLKVIDRVMLLPNGRNSLMLDMQRRKSKLNF